MVFASKLVLATLALTLCAIITDNVASCQAVSTAIASAIPDLIRQATQYGAPFTQTALDRLHLEIFGNATAARSTDVIIFNKSGLTFKLNKNECVHGGYAPNLFPEHEIGSKQSSVFAMTSHGALSGLECTTKYTAPEGVYFVIVAGNPYIGKNWMEERHSWSLEITSTRGTGNNNQLRWIVEDRVLPPIQTLSKSFR
ncbi:uncharacterized protein LOC119075464 [Bradysia coprophila]|uniref:uncharacterized protein LOC119075464 n=1 Tax=Bradysia coprophila TaxID=38358 RepID=UPI00187D9E82|nr:uncharacterized protein LOC119075464 [Bradysia coprophila]